ncbi:MAG TPA: MBL fold metallo-hydrolase [Candidatus Sulfotelmatobacter sp.]|nr:MBL fold metallo-hydrolase [Candidatus Sulfotelmatobacter sp.]
MHRIIVLLIAVSGLASQNSTQAPEWCRALPRPEYRSLGRVNVPDKWFEVYKVRPGIFAIYEPHQAEEVISYLIIGEKQALLFDTGMGISDIKKLVEGLTELPVSVINSHTHNDHIGDNWRFSHIYGLDTAFTRESAKGSKKDAQEEISPDAVCGQLPPGFNATTYATRPFHITNWIHGGEKIDLGGRVLEVISTPGHTPDATSLWDAANGLLFTGDMYYPGPIYLYRPETDLDAYEASIKKMVALKAKLLLPAHNLPIGNPADLPRVLTAMRQVRSGKIKPARMEPTGSTNLKAFHF